MTEEQNQPVETETAPPKRKIGRPPAKIKSKTFSIKLPLWLIEKLKECKGRSSYSKMVKYALCKTYGLEAPKDL